MSSTDPPGINYFEPPSAPVLVPAEDPDAGFRLFKTWELLRIIYNGILLVETLVILAARWPSNPSAVGSLLAGVGLLCLLANLCYCVGPVLNFYANWIGLKHRIVTFLIFVPGTLLSMLLAFLSLMLSGRDFD